MNYSLKLFFCLFLAIFWSCKKDSEIKKDISDPTVNKPVDLNKYGSVTINFTNYAGTEKLVLNDSTYSNANSDQFTVSKFKYYISNVVLKNANGNSFVETESYYLVDQNNGNSFSLVIDSLPVGTYNGINFVLGVDSARNTSGSQSGALDPTNGMFWSWNQGYIFLMMEGYSPNSNSFNNTLTFHLGGFTKPYNCIRNIEPSFGARDLIIAENKASKMEIKTDLLELFESPSLIKFAQTSEGMGGAVAVTIANNAVNMFSITSIEN
jgi:hypothetical protein